MLGDKRTQLEKHLDELYAVFYTFYADELKKDPPPYEKVRLVMSTQFFDDIKLNKLVLPLFSQFPTTVDHKRAVARAAYFDALTIHNRTAGIVWKEVPVADIAKGKVEL